MRISMPVMTFFLLLVTGCSCGSGSGDHQAASGWAVGTRSDGTAVILYTGNSGITWEVQGDGSRWNGHDATDISAVDERTAWVALGSSSSEGGMILHTSNGGSTWSVQGLPQAVPEGIKAIKGISRDEAWAVGLGGPVFHTTNGGAAWRIVPTPGIVFRQVNRMDVRGNDLWIADYGSGENGMIHSPDRGQTWRREHLPGVGVNHGPMTASIVNAQVAWASVNLQGELYRTLDGGRTWRIDAPDLSGPNDIDDVCAVSVKEAWAVQNTSGGGIVLRVNIVGNDVAKRDWYFPEYVYEGVSAFDAQRAWIVGYRGMSAPADLPQGSILYTGDGGETWMSQRLPLNDVNLWKVSFVGACR